MEQDREDRKNIEISDDPDLDLAFAGSQRAADGGETSRVFHRMYRSCLRIWLTAAVVTGESLY